jgi:hypothetical protein
MSTLIEGLIDHERARVDRLEMLTTARIVALEKRLEHLGERLVALEPKMVDDERGLFNRPFIARDFAPEWTASSLDDYATRRCADAPSRATRLSEIESELATLNARRGALVGERERLRGAP